MSFQDHFISKLVENFSFEPTSDQKTLFEKLSEFNVSYHECDILVINGYAGTGKTSAIGAFVKTLKSFELSYCLMAPTGRAAKVLSSHTGEKAMTIHKTIYRRRDISGQAGSFTLSPNKSKDTIFIVDEASLIGVGGGNDPVSKGQYSSNSMFGTGDLLYDLIRFIRSGIDNKLILIGDSAQLPPIGHQLSPALSIPYLKSSYGNVWFSELSEVVRQSVDSGILFNATIVRKMIEKANNLDPEHYLDNLPKPELIMRGFDDIESINGGDLIEKLTDSIDKYGIEETVVLCRSNKRANKYNEGIRSVVLYMEEQLTRGDRIMVVKNCYNFESAEDAKELDFIANGDIAKVMSIRHYDERYGLHFADAELSFPDYNNIELSVKVILDTLTSETASLSYEIGKTLFEGVLADYEDLPTKAKKMKAVMEDPYYNALQIKYASAITCHKSQGGQWSSVFVDNPFWKEETTVDDLKWLYTAMTRAVDKLYLVNFPKDIIPR